MSRIPRKTALSVGDAIKDFLKQYKLATGLNTQLVFKAWDDASGAGKYTLKKYFREGRLYITLSSSVVRSQLSFQKDILKDKINEILATDDLFTGDNTSGGYVKELILK